MHNKSELDLAKEVAAKSQNPAVKRMAEQMVQTLSKTHEQLAQTAKEVGLDLPSEIAMADVQEVRIVAALPADQMDRYYTASAQADNADDLSTYQSQAQIAQDPRVRKFAQDQVSGIQDSTQSCNRVAQGMNMPYGGAEAQPAGAKMRGDR